MRARNDNRSAEVGMDQGFDQGVGAEIKRLREEREWSMAKLAVEADMSVSGVSMIENGKRNLTTTTLAKLARAFGVEVRDLFPLGQTPLPDFADERRPPPLRTWTALVNRLAGRWEKDIEEREDEWREAQPHIKQNVKRIPNLHWANEIRETALDVMNASGDELTVALGTATSAEALELFSALQRLGKVIARTDPWYSSAGGADARKVIDITERLESMRRDIGVRAS
jgi:transcriptional regulator with XRE-family HTH domain